MTLRINQNVLSIRTQGQLAQTADRLDKSVEKLSSGLRINRAADDAAGLAISEKLRRQIRGLARATMNAQDGISMIQTAEGALNETQGILQRMRELAIQASNDTLTSNDRLEIQKEVNQLRDDINRISRNTEFNTKKLLDGSQTALISGSSNSVRGIVVGDAQAVAGDYEVSITLVQGGVSEMQRSQTFLLNDGSGLVAKGNTKLQSIAQLYDPNGVFTLASPQALTINGNGKSTSIAVDGQMTLDKLAASIQNAVVGSSGLGLSNSKVGVVNTAQTGLAGLGGYVQITSGFIGEVGKIAFAGDQRLMDSLGLAVNRESLENQVNVTLRDSSGNTKTLLTTDSRVSGLLGGIDLAFTSQAAQIAGTKGLQEGLAFTVALTFQVVAGGVTSNITIAAGNANFGYSLEGIARDINAQVTATIGLSASVVDGQIRLSYERPATAAASIGTTIQILSAAASAVVDILGVVNGTYSGFVQGQKNQSYSVWGFSNYATAAVALTFTIDDGTGANVAVNAYSTVTTVAAADLLKFAAWQASVNSTISAGTAAVRVDQVGSTIAFTSLRVGKENPDGAAAIRSMVSVTTNNAVLNRQFDLSDGTAIGSGDKNFRVHIVSNAPNFQIGGDPGQKMNVNFSNMDADALGVSGLDLTTVSAAAKSIAKINNAIDKVSGERSKLGAFQNRLEYAINNIRNTHSNLTAAESRIRDADVAQEMIEFTRNQIVNQSGTAMLAQANLLPQGVLQLLR